MIFGVSFVWKKKSVLWGGKYDIYIYIYIYIIIYLLLHGARGGEWLRHYATNRQVAVSIPDGVIGIFQ